MPEAEHAEVQRRLCSLSKLYRVDGVHASHYYGGCISTSSHKRKASAASAYPIALMMMVVVVAVLVVVGDGGGAGDDHDDDGEYMVMRSAAPPPPPLSVVYGPGCPPSCGMECGFPPPPVGWLWGFWGFGSSLSF